ncbi:MAG: class I SAM-dependent methyltransferase [Candidatus Riflebacteria bacterium]|nr:class I SAM-dependent methyltransferase [Candidatus Riflebacteria bacterium]
MIKSKAWDWSINKSGIWEIPSQDSYYLVQRWKEKNYVRFLDLGCGLGRHSFQFARAGFSTFAFDLSSEAIDYVKRIAIRDSLHIQADLGDMTNLPYEDSFFDCVLAYNVISHTDTTGIAKVVTEIERVLKVDGEMFVSLCSKNAWSYRDAGFPVLDENTVRKIEDGPENNIPHFFADRTLIGQLFSGFEVENLRHIQDMVVNKEEYESWHYFLLGIRNRDQKHRNPGQS